MFSSAPRRPRSALVVFGIGLGLSGLWMLLPELHGPKPVSLAFDRNGTEAAVARRTRAVLVAEIGAMRGDLWAEAALTGARLMGNDRWTSLDQTNSGQLARARANAEPVLALAPVNGAEWFFLARLPASSQDSENRVGTRLEMSHFTASVALDLAPWRLERAATSSALADKDLQAFVNSNIRAVLDHGPEFHQAIVAAYRNAWPTSLFSNLLRPIPIRAWPNCLAPASQNESGWPGAAASWKTGVKFVCPSSPAGLDI